jgi:hypothetical protein
MWVNQRDFWSLMAACTMAAIFALALPKGAYGAGPRSVAAAFTATTTNMTPAGLDLRVQILQWQEADARAEVVAALASGSDVAKTLAKLPTVGYIWPASSPVGYSLKYAQRSSLPDGGERITLVTDKRMGSYDFKGWSVPTPVAPDLPYSVVELDVPSSGAGTGQLSLATEVMVDEAAGTVSLAAGSATANVLTNVKREAAKP